MFTKVKFLRVLSRLLIATTATGLVAMGYNAWPADRPLRASDIIKDWETHPKQDKQAYIDMTIRDQKVGFFPTNRVRRELCDNLVPIEVINALKFHFHDSTKFQFQVWRFQTGPASLTPDQTNRLAKNIIQQLHIRTSELSDVFTHSKPPLPDQCVQESQSRPCSDSTFPRLRVTGTIGTAGGRLKAIVELAYVSSSVSPPQNQPIGKEPRTTIILARTDEALMNAAKDIVSKLYESLREEMTEPFICQNPPL